MSLYCKVMPIIFLAAEVESKPKTGLFASFVKLFSDLLKFFYNISGNWGWAIILFTVATQLALLPLTIKQMKATKGMQKLQPQIAALQEKYKDDKETLNMKMMELYKSNNVSMGAGCLPLLIQFPIMIALYQAVLRLDAFHGTRFLWIADLGARDIPLIIATTLVMFFQMREQQKMTGQQNQQNNMMSYMYPVFTLMIGFKLPAGVLIYWATSNLVRMLQNYFMLGNKEPVEKEAQ